MMKKTNFFRPMAVLLCCLSLYAQTRAQSTYQQVISGVVFNDYNADSIQAVKDYGQAGALIAIFEDTDSSGALDSLDERLVYVQSGNMGEYQAVFSTASPDRIYFVQLIKSSLPANKRDVQPYVTVRFEPHFSAVQVPLWISPSGHCTGATDNAFVSGSVESDFRNLFGQIDSIGMDLDEREFFVADMSSKLPLNSSVTLSILARTGGRGKVEVYSSIENNKYKYLNSYNLTAGVFQNITVAVPESTRFIKLQNAGNVGLVVDGVEHPCPATALPVEWTSFKGEVIDDYVLLTWVTESETNNELFEIQRRLNEEDLFETIGVELGMGNSSEETIYTFLDTELQPTSEVAYYRLAQVDRDGQVTYSDVIAIDRFRKTQMVVFPNPANNILHVRQNGFSEVAEITVLNALGQDITSMADVKQIGSAYTIDTRALRKGSYSLQMSDGAKVQIQRFIVVH